MTSHDSPGADRRPGLAADAAPGPRRPADLLDQLRQRLDRLPPNHPSARDHRAVGRERLLADAAPEPVPGDDAPESADTGEWPGTDPADRSAPADRDRSAAGPDGRGAAAGSGAVADGRRRPAGDAAQAAAGQGLWPAGRPGRPGGPGEPYRPWFTAGGTPEPWFAADSDGD